MKFALQICIFFIAVVKSSHEAQKPSIVFDHPSQDYIFPSRNGSGKVFFAIRAIMDTEIYPEHDLRGKLIEWEPWTVVLEVNAYQVGSWGALGLVNSYGELKVNIDFGLLPVGEHVATCLLKASGDEVDIEHTISFHVGDSPGDENETRSEIFSLGEDSTHTLAFQNSIRVVSNLVIFSKILEPGIDSFHSALLHHSQTRALNGLFSSLALFSCSR
jgi:hypothetical protein